jgi:hypothetical protein
MKHLLRTKGAEAASNVIVNEGLHKCDPHLLRHFAYPPDVFEHRLLIPPIKTFFTQVFQCHSTASGNANGFQYFVQLFLTNPRSTASELQLKDAIRRMLMPLCSYFPIQNLHRKLLCAAHVMGPTLVVLTFSGVAHAQGTMDFSGAQTLMGTFKTMAAYIRKADEGTLSRLLVESSILVAASRSNPTAVLPDAASIYKVDTDSIALKVKQEFVTKDKSKRTQPPKKAA